MDTSKYFFKHVAVPMTEIEKAWFALFSRHCTQRASRVEPNTLKTTFWYCCPVIKFALGKNLGPSDFRGGDMIEYLATRKQNRIGNNTLRKQIYTCKAMMQDGVRLRIIKRNPLTGIKYPKKRKPYIATPTPDGLKKLLRGVRDIRRPSINPGAQYVPIMKNYELQIRDQALIITAARGGMRPAEVLNLIVSDYRPDENRIQIRIAKDGEPRKIGLYPDMKAAIDAWLKVRPRNATTDFLFVNDRGLQMKRDWWSKQFRRYADFVGLKGVTPLSLRHFGINQNARKNLLAASANAGHARLETTALYLEEFTDGMYEALAEVPQIDMAAVRDGRSAERIM